jgi:hypothetical protein
LLARRNLGPGKRFSPLARAEEETAMAMALW